MAADGMVKNIDRLFEELGTASLKKRIFSWKAIRLLSQEAHDDYDLLVKENASARIGLWKILSILHIFRYRRESK